MNNSFIITPEYFMLPESRQLPKESGIEDRFKEAFNKVDSNFTLYKDDHSDGVLRYCVDGKVKFYGIQECKLSTNKKDTYHSRIIQAFAYVYTWIKMYPKSKDLFKVLVLPTDKVIDIIYIENILKSAFWTQFCFYYDMHRSLGKGHSASTFYKESKDVRILLIDYISRFNASHYVIGRELDFKIVVNEILSNCL